jgi:hypothetical protein
MQSRVKSTAANIFTSAVSQATTPNAAFPQEQAAPR